jgi:hypothetical protein
MTKIASEMAPYQGGQQAPSAIDLARRFEWRLQWEKSQLENWQAYCCQHNEKFNSDRSTSYLSADNNEEVSEHQPEAEIKTEKLSDMNETSHTSLTSIPIEKIWIERFTAQPEYSSSARLLVTSAHSSGVRFSVSSSLAVEQTARSAAQIFSRQIPVKPIHVYERDGNVEVALRSAG